MNIGDPITHEELIKGYKFLANFGETTLWGRAEIRIFVCTKTWTINAFFDLSKYPPKDEKKEE